MRNHKNRATRKKRRCGQPDSVYIICFIHDNENSNKNSNENGIYDKAYKSFDQALDVVRDRVDNDNEEYKKSANFKIVPELPARMDNAGDEHKSGTLVAHLYDYQVQIYIKKLALV